MDSQTAIAIYRTMVRIHRTDQRIQQGLAAGDLQFQYYPCGGQEAIPATIATHLKPDDESVITYRCIHDIVAKGTPLTEIMAEMYGRESGTSKGKGGPMHLSDPTSGLMVTTGIVGAGAPIATGLALAAKLKGTGRVVTCSFGDGAANIGAVHEALNLAALWKLPLLFVCQNNLYAEYTSFACSTASPDIASRAAAYGMAGEKVDGTDPYALHAAAGRAIARARAGDGPTLLECVAHRLQGHSYGSEEAHMDAALLAAARAEAPVITFRARLIADGHATDADLAALEAGVMAEVDAAQAFAESAQAPGAHELTTDIFADPTHSPEIPGPAPSEPARIETTRRIMFGQAINEAQDQALAENPDVILLGEDIEDPAGGIVKATYGLSTKYGRDRVRGTPISEQAIVGAAIGASLAGLKPIAEIMINDFAMVCMDQIANHAAKLRYMSGGRTSVPIVLRMLTAGKVGSFGAQHSQSLEAWFAHIPGLKIIAPSNAYDAKGMLLAAVDDPDPVIILEAMRCYFVPGPVPEQPYRVPLGKAAIARPGRDLSIISYSWAMQEALAAAETLAADGIEAEVIDLRSLVPLDFETVRASVARTGRALIVHAAVEFCGFGAELAARLQESLWGQLKAPVARLGARYTPIPFAQNLESMHFPDAAGIVRKARALL
ncbi:alpha-ketoacid dehydrogenase subunit alpha/beta [Sandaracinobacteroides saxicola]|uniref:2-oxoglutarate dehydrogenase E1 component n=1 Tax=Sandaracinobacteroides saxicola TaxID=2759707 RepID=A0A7G5II94_9SPHN|nr:dehydrogenase E1 component subunit alpha/beta [Sandaracinobacteroides saxicola]QMW23086.1 dehydrogenase [Sandaracinobacteroides saxicola]